MTPYCNKVWGEEAPILADGGLTNKREEAVIESRRYGLMTLMFTHKAHRDRSRNHLLFSQDSNDETSTIFISCRKDTKNPGTRFWNNGSE